MLPKFFQQLRG